MELIKIYDLDGTLVDTTHRYKTLPCGKIDLPHWVACSTKENVSKDKLLPLSVQYKEDLKNPVIYVVIITARVETPFCREFIEEKLGLPNQIIFRPSGNEEPDFELKKRQINTHVFRLPQFRDLPKYFWDDNFKNVRAFAELGVCSTYVPSKQGHI